ncbi:MAG: hypothetical protein HONBIEJF_00163 [Fimbriimonadaceae bacterium]|nr:hypothetical protein [Fimbriimonadaceae bacterium]
MRILVLGGTRFVGRAIVAECLERGHEPTLLHRGKSGPELFANCHHILADRDGGLDELGKNTWDAVVDTSGYIPRIVQQSVDALSGRCDRYLFISTISVYSETGPGGPSENSARSVLQDPHTETIDAETYGGLKARCEDVVASFAGTPIIVRPGLVVGPYDPTDRFTYWVVRASEGDFLVPEDTNSRIQFIDARDLAAFAVRLLEAGKPTTVNAVGPAASLGWTAFADSLTSVCGGKPVWAPPTFLTEQRVEPWIDLPLWLAGEDSQGMDRVSNALGLSLGLTLRPREETIADTLSWRRRGSGEALKTGMSMDRHAALIHQLKTGTK